MNNWKKKMVLLGLMAELIAMSLSGCENDSYSHVGSSKIIYEDDDSRIGNISYENVDKYLKIVTVEIGESTNKILVIKNFTLPNEISTYLEYIDLETGAVIKKFSAYACLSLEELESREPEIGKDIEIVEEESFSEYLILADNIKKEYDVNELIDFFNNEIKNKEVEEKRELSLKTVSE